MAPSSPASIAPTAARSRVGTSWIAVPGRPAASAPRPGSDGSPRRAEGVGAAAQDRGIARLEAERAGVGGDVGPALIDDADDAERRAHALDVEAVRAVPGGDDGADGIGQGGDLLDALWPSPRSGSASASAGRGRRRRRCRSRFSVGDVLGILGEDRRLAPPQGRGHGEEGGVLLGGGGVGEPARRGAGVPADRRHLGGEAAALRRAPWTSGSARRGSSDESLSAGNIGERGVFDTTPAGGATAGDAGAMRAHGRKPRPRLDFGERPRQERASPEQRIPMNRPIPEGALTKLDRKDNVLAGIGLMVLAVFLFAMNDTLGKWLAETLSGAADPPVPKHLGARHPAPPIVSRAGLHRWSRSPARGCRSSAPFSAASETGLFYCGGRLSAARRRHDLLPRRADLRDGARGALPRREGRLAAVERDSRRLRRRPHRTSPDRRLLRRAGLDRAHRQHPLRDLPDHDAGAPRHARCRPWPPGRSARRCSSASC